MEWEQGIDTAECCNEMILECTWGGANWKSTSCVCMKSFSASELSLSSFRSCGLSLLLTSLVWSVLYAARMLAAVRLGMGCRNGVAVIVVEDH